MGESEERPAYAVSAYTVYPTGFDRVAHPAKFNWCLRVVDAGDGWAIRLRSRCMNYRGDLEFEPPRAARTQDFLQRCRFNEYAALRRARREIDDLVVDGLTFEEFVAEIRAASIAKASRGLEQRQGADAGSRATRP